MSAHEPHQNRTYTVIDLFAGCGGMSAGFGRSGRFRTLTAVELDPFAAATYALNFGEAHVFQGDIAEWLEGPIPSADVVIGGPPCQGFSALGRQDPDDPRNVLWRRYVDTLVRARPEAFVLENVPQFLTSSQYQDLRCETDLRGCLAAYELEHFVVNSARYGTGQARRRAIVIGRRRGLPAFGPPEPLNPEDPERSLKHVLLNVDPRVTTVDLPDKTVRVLGMSLPGAYRTFELHVTRRPTERSLQRYAHIRPGGNRHQLPDHLSTPGWRKHKTGAGDVMGRLVWDKPSVTIRTEFFKPEKGRYLHPDEDRAITHYEAALIQGFDDDYRWCGKKTAIARQIGNAVPVRLAHAIGAHIASRLDDHILNA